MRYWAGRCIVFLPRQLDFDQRLGGIVTNYVLGL